MEWHSYPFSPQKPVISPLLLAQVCKTGSSSTSSIPQMNHLKIWAALHIAATSPLNEENEAQILNIFSHRPFQAINWKTCINLVKDLSPLMSSIKTQVQSSEMSAHLLSKDLKFSTIFTLLQNLFLHKVRKHPKKEMWSYYMKPITLFGFSSSFGGKDSESDQICSEPLSLSYWTHNKKTMFLNQPLLYHCFQ